MKSLIDTINKAAYEANRIRVTNNVNIIVGCSGSMNSVITDIQDIFDFYNKPNLYLLNGNKIIKFDSVHELTKSLDGGHTCSFDELNNFYKEHIGELNIFIQN